MRRIGVLSARPRTIRNGRLAGSLSSGRRSWDGPWGATSDRAPRRSGDGEILRRRAAELVALAPDVIVANGNSPLGPLLQATRQVPVVFVNVSDPVGAGFVASLARPGGNATGFTMFEYGMSGKWLELLKQIAPGLKHAAVLRDAASSAARAVRRPVRGSALARGAVSPVDMREPDGSNAASRHSQARLTEDWS